MGEANRTAEARRFDIEGNQRAMLRMVARMVENALNGDLRGEERHIAFALVAYPFGPEGEADVNFTSNHTDRAATARVLRAMADRLDVNEAGAVAGDLGGVKALDDALDAYDRAIRDLMVTRGSGATHHRQIVVDRRAAVKAAHLATKDRELDALRRSGAEEDRATIAALRAAGTFQARNRAWMDEVFTGDPTDLAERVNRFGEESLELQQSLGQTAAEAHALVDYVHGRPIGEPAQEMGGTMNTLACLAEVAALDMMACGEAELARVSSPAMVDKIRAKRSRRHGRGALPGTVEPDFIPTRQGAETSANAARAESGFAPLPALDPSKREESMGIFPMHEGA